MKTKAKDAWPSKKREPKFINNLSNKDFKQLQSSLQRQEEQLQNIESRLQQMEAILRLLLANQLLLEIPTNIIENSGKSMPASLKSSKRNKVTTSVDQNKE